MRPPALETANTELNMTPMIDIVFQLILFFLLNLRFKSIDYRIDAALPQREGDFKTPDLVPPTPKITVQLFRLDAEDPERARTQARLGASSYTLPAVTAPQAERDACVSARSPWAAPPWQLPHATTPPRIWSSRYFCPAVRPV